MSTNNGNFPLESPNPRNSIQISRKRVLSSAGNYGLSSSPKKQRNDNGRQIRRFITSTSRPILSSTPTNTRNIATSTKRSRNEITNDENLLLLPNDDDTGLEERVKRLRIGNEPTVNRRRFFITSFIEQSVDTVDVNIGSGPTDEEGPPVAVFNITLRVNKEKGLKKCTDSDGKEALLISSDNYRDANSEGNSGNCEI